MADKGRLEVWLHREGLIRYKEAVKLSIEDSKDDQETEPYKSKYAAREILLELKQKVESFATDGANSTSSDIEVSTRLQALESVIQYDLAFNHIETEEKGTGERSLYVLKDKLEDLKLENEFCFVAIRCNQQLGMLWNARSEYEKSLGYFNEAEKLCTDFKRNFDVPPFGPEELFTTTTKENDIGEVCDSDFENLHTLTLYYISQVYKNMGENEKASVYCFVTLRRQLVTGTYRPADWAVNCATLSQYYLTQENYKYAKHCLASASCIIAECPKAEENKLVDLDTEGEDERKSRECIPQAKADVALCWSKYFLNLLQLSSKKIRGENDLDQNHLTDDEKEMLRFESLDVSELESKISHKIANNFEEARVLFLAGQQHLNDAKAFYELDGHVLNHVEIVQDNSQLFKHLAFFDSDLERQCKMCKRRVDMLTDVQTELNPQHYLLICRQLLFEIASVYGDMADLKTCVIESNKPSQPSAHQIKKINSLLGQSAKFYASFIDSLKHEGKLPEKYDESVLRVALLAHLCLARMLSKIICAAKEQRVENLNKSLELYKYIVDYCDRDAHGVASFGEEVQVCRDMVELLPYRILKISNGQA